MKWYAVSGSWRKINDEVEQDVRNTVKTVISNGDGVITGGALGVDYVATQTVLEFGDVHKQLKLYLPIKLDELCKHYFRRANEGVITLQQAEKVTSLLKKVSEICKDCIYDEWGYTRADQESYYGRNTKIIEDCDGLYAFQVNDSKGTQDAINKAKSLGKQVIIKKYQINDLID